MMQIGSPTSGAVSANTGGDANKAALDQAARQFEAIFMRQMIGAMRSASLAEGITDSSATQQFRDMADARTADAMAGKGSLGIAELLLRQFGGTVAAQPVQAAQAPSDGDPAKGA